MKLRGVGVGSMLYGLGYGFSRPDFASAEVDVAFDGSVLRLRLSVSERARETRSIRVPLLFSYDKQTDSSKTSILLGLFRFRKTRAAWDVRLLWLVSFGGGDADRLEEVKKK